MRNESLVPDQRPNIVNRGKSFSIRVDVITRIHGRKRDGETDNTTLLALKVDFLPGRVGQRARMATIALKFLDENGTSGPDAPTVEDYVPKKIQFKRISETTGDPLRTTVDDVPSKFGDQGVVIGHLTTTGNNNTARWDIRENESTKTGVPESLIVAVLLRRTNQKPFSMVPLIDVTASGSAFAQALASRRSENDPIIFHPTSAFGVDKRLFRLTNEDRENLQGFWRNTVLRLQAVRFLPPSDVPGSDSPSDDRVPAGAGGLITPIEGLKSLSLPDPEFKKATYVELWNISVAKPGAVKGPQWKDLGDSVDKATLEKHFSWVKDELKVDIPREARGEQHSLQTNMTEASGLSKGRSVEVLDTTDTLCSLLVHKAESQVSLQSFEDLQKHLNKQELGTITEFFELQTEHYIRFRKVDGGSCDLRSSGQGNDASTSYFIQTPYCSGGFWSMYLAGRADPKSPDRARKLSGLIQTDADVKLEKVLQDAASKVGDPDYRHPLLLPYFLYTKYIEESSEKVKKVLEKVESVEKHIREVLDKRRQSKTQPQSKTNEDDNPEAENWTESSNLLHDAHMGVVEMTRRRRFEKEFLEALQKELGNESLRPAKDMNHDVEWYSARASSDQSEIQEMSSRIESLNNLINSMISQQDNALSIRLAREGLYDSKAMKSLSLVTFLFLPGTFVATIFTTNVVSFQDASAERMAFIEIVIPLTAALMIIYGLFQLLGLPWSKSKRKATDAEAGESLQNPGQALKMD